MKWVVDTKVHLAGLLEEGRVSRAQREFSMFIRKVKLQSSKMLARHGMEEEDIRASTYTYCFTHV